MKTMDHATAMRKAIAESYVLDELSEEERAEFEAHLRLGLPQMPYP